MAPPRNAEEMQKFINEYDQKVAAEEAAESSFWRRFNSNVGAWLGAVVAGGILYVLHCVDDVSSTLSDVWGSFLRQLSEESQRKILLQAARWRVLPKDMDKDDPYLVTEPLEGLRFFAPVGLAPGLDPLGEGITAFFDLGFAFVEVGPVAPGSSESAALAHTLSTRDSSQQIARFGLLGASIGGSKEELLEQISSLGSYVRYFAVDAEHVRDVDALPKLMRELTLAALKLPGGPRIFLRPAALQLGHLRKRYAAVNLQPTRHYFLAGAVAAAAVPWACARIYQQPSQRPQRRLLSRCEGGATPSGLRIDFCGRPAKGFTPIFYSDPVTNTASVNAGDYNLYVGGGSINLAFAKELGQNPKSNGYKEMHEALLAAAADAPGRFVSGSNVPEADKIRAQLGLLGCFARLPEGRAKGDLDPVGAAFLDIFGTERPLSQKNVAMLYVVGPKGTGAPGGHGPTIDSAAQFLEKVAEMAQNALALVAAYNDQIEDCKLEMPRIETLQFCCFDLLGCIWQCLWQRGRLYIYITRFWLSGLVSGGVYMHPESTKKDVAKAILQGLQCGVHGKALPVVRFAYDSHCFEDAAAEMS
ncbi:Dihydroorotate dehydrogenase (quinone) [Durusdinium trenchii]|uniref:Mitochondrial (DHOD) (DHODase) (DHOdehase) (Dihydroorotate oxidase) n=1 Tax=Durusdinium trenchii TaxID=1381693 RepID=A0ABP0QES6_9DINO